MTANKYQILLSEGFSPVELFESVVVYMASEDVEKFMTRLIPNLRKIDDYFEQNAKEFNLC